MNIGRFKSILREELNRLLKERVSSKVLGPEKLEKQLKKYLDRNYDVDTEKVKVEKGPYIEEWDLHQYLSATLPEKVVDQENWNRFFKPFGYYVMDSKDGQPEGDMHRFDLWRVEQPKVDPPRIVYHYTPKNKLFKIKEKGLVPRKSPKSGFTDDPRIHFVGFNKDQVDKIGLFQMRLRSNFDQDKPPFGDKIAKLEVDTTKVNGDFYADMEDHTGSFIFTRANVPPDAIVNWDEFRNELSILKHMKKDFDTTY